jgi:hypothetical protein
MLINQASHEEVPCNNSASAMVGFGRVMSGFAGFNPVEIMAKLVGTDGIANITEDFVQFVSVAEDLSPTQLESAKLVMESLGLGMETQQKLIDEFVQTLSPVQLFRLQNLQQVILSKLIASMKTNDGHPSPQLVKLISETVQERSAVGSTPAPALVQALNKAKDDVIVRGSENNAELQAMMMLQTIMRDVGVNAPRFGELLPLLDQLVVVGGVMGLRAHDDKSVLRDARLQATTLVQARPHCWVLSL